uniref:Ig-like domain-containing protein n=1 Tax=Zonotrichia albicollis TaxID=44394 RepID=A0A8D2MG64_ZONAL
MSVTRRTAGSGQTRPRCPGFLCLFSPVPPVLESPESSEEQMVAQGSDVTFTCKATGSPAPTVTWLKNGEPLGQQRAQVPRGPQLSLVAVAPADAGIYSCWVPSHGDIHRCGHPSRAQVCGDRCPHAHCHLGEGWTAAGRALH